MGCVRAIAGVCFIAFSSAAQVNVLTYKNDNARTGQNLNEPLLSPANVNAAQFGRRYVRTVDGYIYAQPLYVAAVPMAGGNLHDIIVLATAHDSVYAFDADSNAGVNGTPLWQVSFIDPNNGVTAVPYQDVNCVAINPELGIMGTPVIDPATFTIYLVAFTKETGADGIAGYVHRLHALDVRSGRERAGSPVEIRATAPGTGDGGATLTFVPADYKERAALLLANGLVYTSWSSHCDNGTYHGWIIGYKEDTLEQAAVFVSTPNSSGASFWNAGAGPSADTNGSLFVVSANGEFDQMEFPPDVADSVIRLLPDNGLTLSDYFTPFNQALLQDLDLDLGSSGALLLPPEVGSEKHPNLLVTAGKEGRIYLLDRDRLGEYNGAFDEGALQTITLNSSGVFGSAAYFSGQVYFSAGSDRLRAFGIATAVLSADPVSISPETMANPGSSPSVSAYGSRNGIVWAYGLDDVGAVLRAFDASDVSRELYNDTIGDYTEFAVPTVADGKVYVGALNNLIVYGLLPPVPGMVETVVNSASFNTSIASGSLISIYGSNLAQATASAASIPLPVSLADTSLTVNGAPAPLLYVSPTQINAQAPPQIAAGPATLILTTSGTATSSSFTVAAAAPQIFVASATRILALNQDGNVNSAAHPAPSGSIITIFVTGQGAMASPSASIGGLPAAMPYCGPAPGTVGVGQINMQVPSLPPGDYPLQVTLNGMASNSGIISVD